MRLTRFNTLTKEYEYHLNNPNTSIIQDEIAGTQKLGQLEDIEEELGIDLVTLFKALKNGIWASMYGEKIVKGTTLTFISKNILGIIFEPFIPKEDFKPYFIYRWGVPNDYSIYYLKDYGKTWALTKEELCG